MQRMLTSNQLTALGEAVGHSQLFTDPKALQHYGTDWSRQFQPAPSAVVKPKTMEAVQQLVLFANRERLPLVPSGGRTGLSAGAVAAHGEVVVSMEQMNQIYDFNPIDRTVTCGPGLITAQLQQFADEKQLFYPVDFASSGSSQIGGNIATNAGGIKVLRYGLTRDWITGLKVVTGTGERLDLNKGLIKNATGYDLRHLFIGSEGTLGIIVEATVKLTCKPGRQEVLVVGVPAFDDLMHVLQMFQAELTLSAFEFFSEEALQHVLAASTLKRPFEARAPFYALIEFEHTSDHTLNQVMACFQKGLDQGWLLDGVISQSDTQAATLWQLRENISETISHFTPYKNDLSVKVSQVPDFLADVQKQIHRLYPNYPIIWFGHIGDGNVHLNILKPENVDSTEFFQQCHMASQEVFAVVEQFGGSISAEHGVGMIKKPYLHYSRSPGEIAAMRAVKAVFDPNNIMNPGKLF